jgi:Lipid A 3-O-deacylase (PagL)
MKPLCLFLLLIIVMPALSQPGVRRVGEGSVGINYYSGGRIGYTYQHLNNGPPWLMEVFFAHSFSYSAAWVQAQRTPQWGIGLFGGQGGSSHIGKLGGLYPFLRLPLYTIHHYHADLRAGFGLGWAEKTFGRNNLENTLVSTHFNALSTFVWMHELSLDSRHYLDASIGLYHYSNGKLRLPNLGIDMPVASLGYRYLFQQGKIQHTNFDSINREVAFRIFLSAGLKQYPGPKGNDYGIAIISFEAGKQFSFSSLGGAGVLVSRDPTLGRDSLMRKSAYMNNMQLGVYGLYEYVVGKLSIPVQLGCYLYNANTPLFECIGLRYHFPARWYAQLLLKAHLYKADIVQLGLGLKID